MLNVTDSPPIPAGETAAVPSADGRDFILAAADYIRGVLPSGGVASGAPTIASQKARLREWADGLGLLLAPDSVISRLQRGGQEHDFFHDDPKERVIKVTRNGFGLAPGLELTLVASGGDGRRFFLWDATPLEYLERLHLQNLLVPGLNTLEGVIDEEGEMAIIISQPRFELVRVSVPEIDDWFASLGFRKITAAGYYRPEDNLAVFDAHEKNVVRFEDDLIPFDVIPCLPEGGFLQFIERTLAAGQTLKTEHKIGGVQA